MIHFIQPYAYDLNIGKAYNKAIEPLDGWICITDQDTLKFSGFAEHVKQIVDNAKENQVITCMTNRLRKGNANVIDALYDETDINAHLNKFNQLWDEFGYELQVTNMAIAGVFMLFHKSVWDRVKFVENSYHFDGEFTESVRKLGYKTCVAKGLYIFHLYRWNKPDPSFYIKHLIQKNNQ